MADSDLHVVAPLRTRRSQREATRTRLLQAAVSVLIEQGVARTTTLEVQRHAEVSRGALLHHFPTHAELLSATVAELVKRNEESVWRERNLRASETDPLAAAVRTLAAAASTPSYVAELELWAVARTDLTLRQALRNAERAALKERERVMADLFGATFFRPGGALAVDLTVEFVRGLALSDVLRTDPTRHDELIEGWIAAVNLMLDRVAKPTE